MRLIREQADKLQDEKSVRRGETISFVKVQQFIRELVANCSYGGLDRLSNEFPVSLKGCDELAIKMECDRQIELIKDNLRKKLATMAAQAPCDDK